MLLMANTTLPSIISAAGNDHSSHPNFLHLAGLVCEAVLEVIFVALPGYLVAWTGMFDAHSQKLVAELNTMVFTPCLIFTKLASQLNADKLTELAVIPFIFVAQTVISWLSAQAMARLFGFGGKEKKRQKNFIVAMGVFGNSNSLPISLVLSLSKTISGLHWDKIPGDNDDEVGARGILYLMIFQQLGQLLRWTWGYSVLLKPASAYEEEEREEDGEEERSAEEGRYRDFPDEEEEEMVSRNISSSDLLKPPRPTDSGFGSGSQTPLSIRSSEPDEEERLLVDTGLNNADPNGGPVKPIDSRNTSPRSANGGLLDERSRSTGHITTFPNFSTSSHKSNAGETIEGWKAHLRTQLHQLTNFIVRMYQRISTTISTFFANLFRRLPSPVQKTLAVIHNYHMRFWAGVWRQMNPPLWAMLAALIVASIPKLQEIFFTPGTLVNNSVSRAIQQSGGVAVPLILVVLGANLARSTLPQDQLASTPEEKKEEKRLLWASLLSRMVLPTLFMSPVLAAVAKWVPVSILDDPIFIIVCFLLTGAPSALQLAQICQINNVFMGAMSNLLVASYVVAIFPSTLVLVMLALEVVEWAVI
jgi:predicted permease